MLTKITATTRTNVFKKKNITLIVTPTLCNVFIDGTAIAINAGEDKSFITNNAAISDECKDRNNATFIAVGVYDKLTQNVSVAIYEVGVANTTVVLIGEAVPPEYGSFPRTFTVGFDVKNCQLAVYWGNCADNCIDDRIKEYATLCVYNFYYASGRKPIPVRLMETLPGDNKKPSCVVIEKNIIAIGFPDSGTGGEVVVFYPEETTEKKDETPQQHNTTFTRNLDSNGVCKLKKKVINWVDLEGVGSVGCTISRLGFFLMIDEKEGLIIASDYLVCKVDLSGFALNMVSTPTTVLQFPSSGQFACKLESLYFFEETQKHPKIIGTVIRSKKENELLINHHWSGGSEFSPGETVAKFSDGPRFNSGPLKVIDFEYLDSSNHGVIFLNV